MSPEASDWLTRADQALGSAELLADSDPDAYTRLQLRRITGDYGGELHVNRDDARDAIEAARQIVQEVRRTLSES